MLSIAKKYRNVKNYIYSRYHSTNSYLLIHNNRKYIRDPWTDNGFIKSFGLNTRYVRNAIEDACSNLKTNWIQTLNKVRNLVYKNENLSQDQKHIIFTILKSKELTQLCFNRTLTYNDKSLLKFKLKNQKELDVLVKYINRLTRKCKNKIPYTKKLSFMIDNEMYSYKDNSICIMGLVNGKRLLFKVNTKQRFEGSIRICIKDNNRLVINKCIERKVKELNPLKFNKVVGIDKNLNNLFDTSNGTTYGKNFSDLNNCYTEVLFEKNKKRQFYHQL